MPVAEKRDGDSAAVGLNRSLTAPRRYLARARLAAGRARTGPATGRAGRSVHVPVTRQNQPAGVQRRPPWATSNRSADWFRRLGNSGSFRSRNARGEAPRKAADPLLGPNPRLMPPLGEPRRSIRGRAGPSDRGTRCSAQIAEAGPLRCC